jgi:hypothetical protein
MIKIIDDLEAIQVIHKLLSYEFDNEDESTNLLLALENYQSGIAEIITTSKENYSPAQILQRARELSKPILL